MSTTPHDEQLDVRPFWTVQMVFDPDGQGHDFAYTIGLFEAGLPELHMYARPGDGADPGADWKFSTRDCCSILNGLASMLVRGSLDIGSTVRREYDGGLAVVDYRVDPPGDRDELEAYGIHPDASVLPVRWSLTRPPEGPAVPLSEEAERSARQRYEELLGRIDVDLPLPRGWELPAEPSFDVSQRFGPMTPLVLARAAHIFRSDARTVGDFAVLANAVEDAASLSYPAVRARAIGRASGRTAAIDAVVKELTRLFDEGPHDARLRRCWKQVVDDLMVEASRDQPGIRRSHVDHNVRGALFTGILACLAGEVVADLADEELRLWATGPWEAASSSDGSPGPDWHAAESVLTTVRRVLAGLSAEALVCVGAAHYCRIMDLVPGGGSEVRAYADLRNRVTSWALISAACCPRPSVLLGKCPGAA
ncbi:MAG TPA: hypothetical protein VFG63_15950, partial [Nocardioidaceae bacterium]|nr:hypothetical protein [Nocardioidaceae bacterium]